MRITERGQITIPKALRDRFGITPATELVIIPAEEGLLIAKRMQVSPFRKFLGKANARGLPRTTDQLLRLARDRT